MSLTCISKASSPADGADNHRVAAAGIARDAATAYMPDHRI